ncbi:MAG TPA: DinB family protein [Gemmataceae bacterium]|jgi:uncharacterized damage-inducible protein DinB|nr:DinB family protein [Gemmataceae bacterium]
MKDDFASLYAYNRWADRRVLDACRKLTAEQYAAEPVSGWSSVRSSLFHIAVVTDGWLGGLAGEAAQTTPTEADFPTLDHIERLLDGAYRKFEALLPALTPERLTTLQTLSRRGRTAVLPPWAVLRHVVNHSTYHRGQVASKLKRLGVEPPATDFVFWALEQVPQQA